MIRKIDVISTHDSTIFPNELVELTVRLTEKLPEGYLAHIESLSLMPERLRISNPTVLYDVFGIAIANFEDGPYWDGIVGDLHGNIFDENDEPLPKGFFGNDERYSIPYDIKKGDVIAVATLVKNN